MNFTKAKRILADFPLRLLNGPPSSLCRLLHGREVGREGVDSKTADLIIQCREAEDAKVEEFGLTEAKRDAIRRLFLSRAQVARDEHFRSNAS